MDRVGVLILLDKSLRQSGKRWHENPDLDVALHYD